jgi:hypothetical protein
MQSNTAKILGSVLQLFVASAAGIVSVHTEEKESVSLCVAEVISHGFAAGKNRVISVLIACPNMQLKRWEYCVISRSFREMLRVT